MQIVMDKLVGASSPTRWSQVHTFTSNTGERLILAISIEAKTEGVDVAAFGTEVVQRMHESYWGEGESKGLGGLTRMLNQVKGEFGEIRLDAAGGVISQGEKGWKLDAAGVGEAEVVLVRGKMRVSLTGVSGYLVAGDRVIVTTKELWNRVSQDKWGETVEALTPIVHAQDSSGVAAVMIEMKTEVVGGEAMAVGKLVTKEAEDRVEKGVWRRWLAQWVGGIWQRRKMRRERPEVFLVEPKEKRRRVAAAVGAVLLVLLVVSLGLGWVRQTTSKEAVALREVQERVEGLVRESGETAEVNPLRSRVLVEEAKRGIEEYKNSGVVSKKGREWLKTIEVRVEEELKQRLRIKEVAEAEIWLDLDLVREGTKGGKMDFDGERVIVLDAADEVAVTFKVKDKKAGVVGGGELLDGSRAVAVYGERGFVVADTGVVELEINRKTAAVVIQRDEEWGEISHMDIFGGNLYLLDKSRGEIYRYRGVTGEKQGWLGQGVAPDFSRVVGMTIDGKIWVLTEGGKVEVYAQGTGKAVELKGLDMPLKEPREIYSDDESERVYILDSGNRRVVVINKQGEYEAQYRWEGMGEVTDLVVDEEQGKILLLSGSKVYGIDL